jgi:alpha-tubulin suppressor-like RCC1 family protein
MGTVWAWGNNTYGQLGDGTRTAAALQGPETGRAEPRPVAGLADVRLIAAGARHNV